MIHAYIHPGSRVGVLVEINCQTDFVARNEEFQEFVNNVGMQIASMTPEFVSEESIDDATVEAKKEFFKEQLEEEERQTGKKKPAAALDKIIEGKVNKWKEEACLLDQALVTDEEGRTVGDIQRRSAGRSARRSAFAASSATSSARASRRRRWISRPTSRRPSRAPDGHSMTELAYSRMMLKLSGEALCGRVGGFGVDPETLHTISVELAEVANLGVELSIVIGGGNIFRGLRGSASGMDRASADYMGMLATVINGIALQDALEKLGVSTRLISALDIRQVAEPYIRRRAVRHLEKRRVVIFVAGTGNPYFSTDTAAALRAMEIQAQVLLKATKVEGIYDKDPAEHEDAKMFRRISYDRFLTERIGVMDSTAVTLCRENKLPIRVVKLAKRGNIKRVVLGEDLGTLVTESGEG